VHVPVVPPKHHHSYKLVLFPAIGALVTGLAILLVIILILLIRRKNKELKKIEGNNPLDAWSFSAVKKRQEGNYFLIFLLCCCSSFMNICSFRCPTGFKINEVMLHTIQVLDTSFPFLCEIWLILDDIKLIYEIIVQVVIWEMIVLAHGPWQT
jgi:hypothetical protein